MRKITFLAAVAATLCTVACNKNMDTQINEVPDPAQSQERYDLTVNVRGHLPAHRVAGARPHPAFERCACNALRSLLHGGE